jgi:hypothetical protein
MKKSNIFLTLTTLLLAIPMVANAAGSYVGFSHSFMSSTDTNWHTATQIKSSTGVAADVVVNSSPVSNLVADVQFCDATRNTCGSLYRIQPGAGQSISSSTGGSATTAGTLVDLHIQAIPTTGSFTYPISLSGSWRSN